MLQGGLPVGLAEVVAGCGARNAEDFVIIALFAHDRLDRDASPSTKTARARMEPRPQAPWSTIKTDRDRAATVLNVALRCVDSLKVLFAPFLPFAGQRVHELLGYGDVLAGPLEFRDVGEDGDAHTILTGRYEGWRRGWGPTDLPEGQQLREPAPLFEKLDPV
jgi:methionyl-tRNA synthetase